MNAARYTRDGGDGPPRLAFFLNLDTLNALPPSSAAPRGETSEVYAALKAAGFEGVQGGDPAAAHDQGLKYAAGGRVNAPGEVGEQARRWKDEGAVAATLHVGWGREDDATLDAVSDDILETSAALDLPLYPETHRATMIQDTWRATRLAQRRPGLRFNLDLSHWYTGLEMPYAGVDQTLDFVAPVLERVGFLHGRIGDGGAMQVCVGDTLGAALDRPNVRHFVEAWSRAFRSFRQQAAEGDYLVFAPELLEPSICYARTIPVPDGGRVEECDRYRQSLLYLELARHAWDIA
ncbi:MAG: hypothetical protein AAF800_06500 [Planctomycetota bacterium]